MVLLASNLANYTHPARLYRPILSRVS